MQSLLLLSLLSVAAGFTFKPATVRTSVQLHAEKSKAVGLLIIFFLYTTSNRLFCIVVHVL
jgi:hypothetical protein